MKKCLISSGFAAEIYVPALSIFPALLSVYVHVHVCECVLVRVSVCAAET